MDDNERPTPTPETPRALSVEEVCAENARNIVKWLMWRGVPRVLVADVSQEVFRAILQSWDTYNGEKGKREGWIYGICRNVARNYRRKERRNLHALLPDDDLMPAPGSTPENIVHEKIDSEFLWSVIAAMEETKREVVIAYLNGLTTPAIAQALAIPQTTVNGRLRAAKDEIRAAFLARDRARKRPGVLPFLLPIDSLLKAEQARIDDVPEDAVVEAHAALDQVLSELGGGPSSGVHKTPPRPVGSPAEQRIAKLLRRLRPFCTTAALGALAVLGPSSAATPKPAAVAITREPAIAFAAPMSALPAAESAAPPQAPMPTRLLARAPVDEKSAAPSSALARAKLTAAIRAFRRGDRSVARAILEHFGPPPPELLPAYTLLAQHLQAEGD